MTICQTLIRSAFLASLVLLIISSITACKLGTFESLDEAAVLNTTFLGVHSIRRDQSGSYSLFWKNPPNISSPRILIYYSKLLTGVEDLGAATELMQLQESVNLPATLYQVGDEATLSLTGDLIAEIANGAESTSLGFPLDPTKSHAFQLKSVGEDGEVDSNNVVLLLSPTTSSFDGCVSGKAIDESSILVDFQYPPDAISMTILRNGIAVTVINKSGLQTASYIDKGLTSDTEYRYTCQANFVDKELMGEKAVVVTTKDPLAGYEYAGCKTAKAMSGTIVRVTFEFPTNAEKVNVYRGGFKRYVSQTPTDIQFDDVGLTEGETYVYTCEALIQGKLILGKDELVVTTIVSNPPTFLGIDKLQIFPKEGNIGIRAKITWKPATGIPASRYEIFATAGTVIDWSTPAAQVDTFLQNYELANLGDDLSYTFGVRACSADTICDTNTVTITETTPDSGAPATVGATEVKASNGNLVITLPWELSQGAVAKRKIYQRIGAVGGTTLSNYDLELTRVVTDPLNPPLTVTLTGILEDTTYHFIARDVDVHGNENSNTNVVSISTTDLTPPFFSGISSLIRKPGSEDKILQAQFLVVADETVSPKLGAKDYLIFVSEGITLPTPPAAIPAPTTDPCMDGTLKYTIANKSPLVAGEAYTFEMTGLKARTLYPVCIKAVDSYGNISTNSNSLAVHTTDLSPPAFDGLQDIKYNGTSATLDIGWNASSSSDVFEYKIRIWKNTNPAKTVIGKSHASFPNGTSIGNAEYPLESSDVIYASVDACDNAHLIDGGVQNCTASTVVKTVTLPDIKPPQNFGGIRAPNDLETPSQGAVLIKWFEPAQVDWDEVGGYRGFTVYTVTNNVLQFLADCPCAQADCSDKRTSCLVSGLNAYRDYTFHVRAYDAAGNVTQTDLSKVSTKRTSDTTPPTFNSNLSVTLVDSKVNLSWSAATDNQYHPSAVIRYQVWRLASTSLLTNPQPVGNGSVVATISNALAYTDSNISDGTTYYYSICAADATWNSLAADANSPANPNRKCDGTVKFISLQDVNPPILTNLTTDKTSIDRNWKLYWNMQDTGNNDSVNVRVYQSLTAAPGTATVQDELVFAGQGTSAIAPYVTFETGLLEGPENTITYINYLVVVEDAAGNSVSGTLSVLSDTEISIVKVSRNSGTRDGGKLVVIEGKGFTSSGTVVTIGGAACSNVQVFLEGKTALPASALQTEGSMLTCVTPAGSSGPADVVVSENGSQASIPGGYTYCGTGGAACTNICDTADMEGFFPGGDGDATPYIVCSATQWGAIENNPFKKFVLMDNIDLDGFTGVINSSENAGSNSYSIDGGGYVVANYVHSAASTTNAGLINAARDSYYKNLGVVNITVDKLANAITVGGLVGRSVLNTFENLYIAGCSVKGGTTGGVVGSGAQNKYTKVESFCNVIATGNAGGLSGNGATVIDVSESLFNGSIDSSGGRVGGLFGYYHSSAGQILDSKVTGSVAGTNEVGGLVGYSDRSPVIVRSHFSGTVEAKTGKSAGGIAGKINVRERSGLILQSSAAGTIISKGEAGGLVGATGLAAMGGDKLLISNSYFAGQVTSTASDTGGIFGTVLSGSVTITQVHSSGQATGTGNVGGILGFVNLTATGSSLKVNNSSSNMNVSGTGNHIGGFIGYDNTTLADDGLVDYARIFVTGSVSSPSSNKVGGFAGRLMHEVADTYSTGSVNGNLQVGGFVGGVDTGYGISRSYATGLVTRNSGGGFVGDISQSLTQTSNFWDLNTTGTNISAGQGSGAAEPKTTSEMKSSATYPGGWNFLAEGGIWTLATDSYPSLRWKKRGWATSRISKICTSPLGAKDIQIFIMNHSLSSPMQIGAESITVGGSAASIDNNTCTGQTLAASYGSCSFRIKYSSTPAVSDVSVTIPMSGSIFENIVLTPSDLDNSCP